MTQDNQKISKVIIEKHSSGGIKKTNMKSVNDLENFLTMPLF